MSIDTLNNMKHSAGSKFESERVSSPGPKIPRKGILYWLILIQPTWAYEYSTLACDP